MIELSLWRARVGCFLNKKLIKSPRKFSRYSNIQLYVLLLLLLSLNKRIRRIKSTFLITLIILLYLSYFNNTARPDYKVIDFSIGCSLAMLRILSVCFKNLNNINNIKFITFILLLCAGDVHPNPGPSPSFNISHLNVRSLMAHKRIHVIKDLILDYHNVQVLCLTDPS